MSSDGRPAVAPRRAAAVLRSWLAGAALAALCWPALAAGLTPVGLWMTVSDTDGKPSGYVRIREAGGEYLGVIERGIEGKEHEDLCSKCDGPQHNQPLVGMTIITGVHHNGERFDGGHILDPDTGNVYKVRLTPVDDGRKLEVRGYIGFSLLGRTQTWVRQPD